MVRADATGICIDSGGISMLGLAAGTPSISRSLISMRAPKPPDAGCGETTPSCRTALKLELRTCSQLQAGEVRLREEELGRQSARLEVQH